MKNKYKTFWILFMFLLTIMLSVMISIYWSARNYYRKDFLNILELRAQAIAHIHIDYLSDSVQKEASNSLFHEQDYIIKYTGWNDLKQQARLKGIDLRFLKKIYTHQTADFTKNEITYKGILYSPENSQDRYVVIAAAENIGFKNFFANVFQKILITIGIVFLASVICSYLISRSIYRPIARITSKVKDITSENLHLRLDEKNINDEIHELSRTFNQMLNRLEASFEIQNNFISNASHELRTPLTAIIGMSDVALTKKRTPEEYVETIKIILEEAEKLDQKTKALLFLAQTGFNGKIQENKICRVDEIVFESIETIRKIDKRYKVNVDLSLIPENPALLKVNANIQLLQLALFNIITNACKYSDYREVHCFIGSSNEYVSIIIKDEGIGIPEDELKFIYDPFFRASNTKTYDGFGIGLPLTRNIIKMHHGRINVTSVENKGTTVHIALPIASI
ncbi:MAG: HAMP domain-containing histidine kinase [Flavobacteriia bacterium]|nr:HAMP domain-containing histidine kinase [Flavobacteriia bacterium]OJX35334.1 MAG: hypothetical protein BGO87_12065 [Flavobacteriia bacterium 40-80]